MKTVSYKNESDKVQVIGFTPDGEVKVLASFGENLTEKTTAAACREATAWMNGDDDAHAGLQATGYVCPGDTKTAQVFAPV